MDNGATSRITDDLNNLSLQQRDYKGKEKIIVGNGHSLYISHTGSSFIPSFETPLLLNNILYAPEITKNLLSVSQITKDISHILYNNVSDEFYVNYYLFKDKATKKVLLRGTLKGGLYQLDISKLEDRFKLGGSTSLHNAKNKTCNVGSVSLLSNVKLFHSSNS